MEAGRQTGRQIGVWAATAVVTGEAISLGIFVNAGCDGAVVGISGAAGSGVVRHGPAYHGGRSLCFTELAVRNPHDGGEYLYLRRGFGRRVAFLYGWMAALVMYPGVAASLCVGTVPYIQALLPVPAAWAPLVPVLLLLALGSLSYAGTRVSGGVMAMLNWLKVPILAGLAGWAL